jgi:adenylate cyclase
VASTRRLAAIMFTDMVGSTAAAQVNEAEALRLRDEQETIVRPLFAAHQGREIKSMGDGSLVVFDSALRAVECAVDIQEHLQTRNSESGPPLIRLRIGIHLGDVEERAGDIFGDSVNVAARIEPLAEAGGICISEPVFGQVRNKILSPLERLGPRALKGVQFPMDVYRVRWAGATERPDSPGPGPRPWDKSRIAVLPFVSLSPDPNDRYFADGLTEEMIATISKLPELEVISRTSVMQYRDQTKNAGEIGRELRAGLLLEGSVRKAGNRIRVTAQLIDAPSDRHLWSQAYDEDLRDIFGIQTAIAYRVAEALRINFGDPRTSERAAPPTSNVEAYLLYLKGRASQDLSTLQGLEKAIELYQQALDLDPAYATAIAAIAYAYTQLGFYELMPSQPAFERAREFAERALRIDPNSVDAHLALGSALRNIGWDYDGAEAQFRKAIELNPNRAEAHERLAMLLALSGRPEEASAEVRRALELDPMSAQSASSAGAVYLYSSREREAVDSLRVALELNPNDTSVLHNLGLALVRAGQVDEGIAAMQRAAQRSGRPAPIQLMELVYGYTRAGRIDEAEDVLVRLKSGSRENPGWSAGVAGALASLGRIDEALQWLEMAYEGHAGFLKAHLGVDFVFDPLRRDPRFEALLHRVGWKVRNVHPPTG